MMLVLSFSLEEACITKFHGFSIYSFGETELNVKTQPEIAKLINCLWFNINGSFELYSSMFA